MKNRQLQCIETLKNKNGKFFLTCSGEKVGEISWWTDSVPEGIKHEKLGVFGKFHCIDEEGARILFDAAYQKMRKIGVEKVIGPMDQSTWNSYRFLVQMERPMPFFMEPYQPMEYGVWLKRAGWKESQVYHSLSASLKDFKQPQEQRMELYNKEGILIQNASGFTDKEMLKIIYEISLQCFVKNLYYVPVDYSVFLARYEPLLSYFRKEYIYIAWAKERPVGFLIAFPDYKQGNTIEQIKTIILKTFGVIPEFHQKGIATLCMNLAAWQARKDGMEEAVMALVYEKNHTMHMMPHGKICSTYMLYEREV